MKAPSDKPVTAREALESVLALQRYRAAYFGVPFLTKHEAGEAVLVSDIQALLKGLTEAGERRDGIDPGDRVKVTESFSDTSGPEWINGIRLDARRIFIGLEGTVQDVTEGVFARVEFDHVRYGRTEWSIDLKYLARQRKDSHAGG